MVSLGSEIVGLVDDFKTSNFNFKGGLKSEFRNDEWTYRKGKLDDYMTR